MPEALRAQLLEAKRGAARFKSEQGKARENGELREEVAARDKHIQHLTAQLEAAKRKAGVLLRSKDAAERA
eukprot:3623167-Pleurochrysis_carterae.AAC.1